MKRRHRLTEVISWSARTPSEACIATYSTRERAWAAARRRLRGTERWMRVNGVTVEDVPLPWPR